MRAQHRKFANEYIANGFIGVQAVYAAGYKLGYDSACVRASLLLRNIKVAKMIDDHINKSKMSADEVVEELSAIAKTSTKIDGNQKLKALEMLAKAHNIIDRNKEPAQPNRDDQMNSAKRSYIIAALPSLQVEHSEWSSDELQAAAEAKFNVWLDSLNLNPVVTDVVQ